MTCSIVRETSTGIDAARRRVPENGSTSPTPRTSGSPAARSSSESGSERIARRLSRTSALESDGAITRTRCPAPLSSAATWPT